LTLLFKIELIVQRLKINILHLNMKYILLSIFTFIGLLSWAQEQLVPLGSNPSLIHAEVPKLELKKGNTKGGVKAVKLPFIDDFSRAGVYPQQQLWADRYVFVNKSYAVNPPSYGVATFDAMDEKGAVYSNMSTFPTVADTLSSVGIRLDSNFSTNTVMSPADSVYLSFYIQPQGNGDKPQLEDSIVLQFYNQKDDVWQSVWNMEGMSIDTMMARYGSEFLQVLIPIKDSAYFGANFKFRFYNYASIPDQNIPSWRSGVFDHWNLDYVFLDVHRTMNDVFHNDVAISGNVTTLLKDYQSMPWNQFLANASAEMDHTKSIKYKRLDDIAAAINVAQYFSIQNLDDKSFFFPNPNPASVNMSTVERVFAPGYSSYTYNSNASPYADFKVEFQTLSSPDENRYNDTLKFFQRFYNYYAYDDGIPEAGYGLSTANGQLAIQFHANTADSIQSVQFFFNQTLAAANQQYFDLQIWNDNNGVPGSVIYTQAGVRPEYPSPLFQYYTYELDHAVAVNGTFYVGWKQLTKDNLNVGWDKTNDHSDQVMYNVTGNWFTSSFDGCAMIRPILGSEKQAYVGIPSIEENTDIQLIIAPNPVQSNQLHLRFTGEDIYPQHQYELRIYNISGQLVIQSQYENNIDISSLQSGIYLIQVFSKDGKQQINKKFIINK